MNSHDQFEVAFRNFKNTYAKEIRKDLLTDLCRGEHISPTAHIVLTLLYVGEEHMSKDEIARAKEVLG